MFRPVAKNLVRPGIRREGKDGKSAKAGELAKVQQSGFGRRNIGIFFSVDMVHTVS